MKHFEEFKEYVSKMNFPFLNHMQDGLSKDEFIYRTSIDITELIELYTWKNGVTLQNGEIDPQDGWLFNFGYMTPIEKAIEYFKYYQETSVLDTKKHITIFESGFGEMYLYNFDRNDLEFGKIYYYTLDERYKSTFFQLFDSLEAFFQYSLLAYKSGIWKFDTDGFTVSDPDKDRELLLATNPGCQFLNELHDWAKLKA